MFKTLFVLIFACNFRCNTTWQWLLMLSRSYLQQESDDQQQQVCGGRQETYWYKQNFDTWNLYLLGQKLSYSLSLFQVLIEFGNKAGYNVINEARDLILSVSADIVLFRIKSLPGLLIIRLVVNGLYQQMRMKRKKKSTSFMATFQHQ